MANNDNVVAFPSRNGPAARRLVPSRLRDARLAQRLNQTELAGLIGVEGATGPTVNQACATSARVIAGAAAEVESNGSGAVLG